ncbi:MAG: hypothetical protein IJI57_04180 [Flexilinea sp.]|nr:hypothetical protein [Flexilinea sp.]
MTRFEKELSGVLGEYWKRNAEREIADMQERADNGEILLDGNCAAYWASNGHYLPLECVQMLSHCAFFFDADATIRAEKEQSDRFLEEYRNTRHELSAEERAEMRAAFGEGTEIVDVISGERYIA